MGVTMRWFRDRETLIFVTLDPPFRRPEWAAGELIDYEGKPYRVTRWVERPPVRLKRGGSVREWEVWGRRVSVRRLRAELSAATDRILKGE
ncbi:MAG: hypothetical protein ACOX8V_05605 [Thermoleophilia bacterium]|jgi:hypothetical protein